jgi:hypothetical protein
MNEGQDNRKGLVFLMEKEKWIWEVIGTVNMGKDTRNNGIT